MKHDPINHLRGTHRSDLQNPDDRIRGAMGHGGISMSFALSGSNITQSGTDTSLAGLTRISGVTTFSQSEKIVYNIGNKTLNVLCTSTRVRPYGQLHVNSVSYSVPIGRL